MDPNATLKEIDSFLAAHETGPEVDEWCQHIFDWVSNGGFGPNWEQYELGTSYYKCMSVSMRKGKRYA